MDSISTLFVLVRPLTIPTATQGINDEDEGSLNVLFDISSRSGFPFFSIIVLYVRVRVGERV